MDNDLPEFIKFLKENCFSILAIVITFIFAYYGFFPFNLKHTEDLHYTVYDSIHLAFNIPNCHRNGVNYYCPLSRRTEQEYTLWEIQQLKKRKSEIDIKLFKIRKDIEISPAYLAVNIHTFRYNLTQFDIDRLKLLQKNESILNNESKKLDEEISGLYNVMYSRCKKIQKLKSF